MIRADVMQLSLAWWDELCSMMPGAAGNHSLL